MKECPTLFLEFHGSESGIEAQTSAVADIAKDFGGSDFEWALKQEDRNKLWTARHKLYYAAGGGDETGRPTSKGRTFFGLRIAT